MRIANTMLLLVLFAVLFVSCVWKPDKKAIPVIGVKGPVDIYKTANLSDSSATLDEGAEITVAASTYLALQIKTASGQEGWVRRCWVCSKEEFERRKKSNLIPQNVVCIKAEGDSKYMYGGTLSIRNGAPAITQGDAFWLDPTMKGKSFRLGSEEVEGDPSVLLLSTETRRLERLPIWD